MSTSTRKVHTIGSICKKIFKLLGRRYSVLFQRQALLLDRLYDPSPGISVSRARGEHHRMAGRIGNNSCSIKRLFNCIGDKCLFFAFTDEFHGILFCFGLLFIAGIDGITDPQARHVVINERPAFPVLGPPNIEPLCMLWP